MKETWNYADEMIQAGTYDGDFFMAPGGVPPRKPFLITSKDGEEILDLIGPKDVRHDMSWRTEQTPNSTGRQIDAARLGSGAFGEVFLGKSEEHGLVAIKITPILDEDQDGEPDKAKYLETEATVLADVRRQPTIARSQAALDGLVPLRLPREGAFFPKLLY